MKFSYFKTDLEATSPFIEIIGIYLMTVTDIILFHNYLKGLIDYSEKNLFNNSKKNDFQNFFASALRYQNNLKIIG